MMGLYTSKPLSLAGCSSSKRPRRGFFVFFFFLAVWQVKEQARNDPRAAERDRLATESRNNDGQQSRAGRRKHLPLGKRDTNRENSSRSTSVGRRHGSWSVLRSLKGKQENAFANGSLWAKTDHFFSAPRIGLVSPPLRLISQQNAQFKTTFELGREEDTIYWRARGK